MSTISPNVWEQALALPAEDRVRLAADLMRSIDGVPAAEIDAAWAEEAESRLIKFRAGQSSVMPADQAIGEAMDWLRGRRK